MLVCKLKDCSNQKDKTLLMWQKQGRVLRREVPTDVQLLLLKATAKTYM